MNNEALIKESGEFIARSGAWGINEFVVFFLLIVVVCAGLVVYFSARQNNKTTEILVRMTEKTNEAITNNTTALNNLSAHLGNQNKGIFQRLESISDDIKELKLDLNPKGGK